MKLSNPERKRTLRWKVADMLMLGSLAISISLTLIKSAPKFTMTKTQRSDISGDSPSWSSRDLPPVLLEGEKGHLPRSMPYRMIIDRNEQVAYVTLAGRIGAPKDEVSVVDLQQMVEIKRIKVGRFPQSLVLHPTQHLLYISNLFSNYISVIDTKFNKVAGAITVPFYCDDLLVARDGKTLYASNFWLNQVIVIDLDPRQSHMGTMRQLGPDKNSFLGIVSERHSEIIHYCPRCGWERSNAGDCPRCSSKLRPRMEYRTQASKDLPPAAMIRASCGTMNCHLYDGGGFYAGADDELLWRKTTAMLDFNGTYNSPLIEKTLSIQDGGNADGLDGRHHVAGAIFSAATVDPYFQGLKKWVVTQDRGGGPGITVGDKPRDMALSGDGQTLYVANTGSLDISVIDLRQMKEIRRIFTRSPVNDIIVVAGTYTDNAKKKVNSDILIAAALGIGSGHPKRRNELKESTDPNGRETEFTLRRDLTTGRPYPLAEQKPLGPYDQVDGTAQEKFRDITNDIVIFHPDVTNLAIYQANKLFTRYTSDSFESLPGDIKGDVDPALMQVRGAFPEQMVLTRDDNGQLNLFVAMAGTFEIQHWLVFPQAVPLKRLVHQNMFTTSLRPTSLGFLSKAGQLVVVAQFDGSLETVDIKNGNRRKMRFDPHISEYPHDDFERGELFVQSSIFSVDQDQSCVHCHYRNASDGKNWSVSQVMGQDKQGNERTGGSREVPDLRALSIKAPFFLEGTLSIDEALTMIMEHNPLIDFQGQTPSGDFSGIFAGKDAEKRLSADTVVLATGKFPLKEGTSLPDLIKRRDVHFHQVSLKYMGKDYGVRDLQNFIGVYQRDESRLFPNPIPKDDVMVQRGQQLFHDPKVGCVGCHPPPNFTDKLHAIGPNKVFPPLVTPAARDDAHTLISADRFDWLNGFKRYWDPADQGRVEENEGHFVAPSLRGLWSRPPSFLHHGKARSLREVIATPMHSSLRARHYQRPDVEKQEQREIGLNEINGIVDTHGVTSHLTIWDMECLLKFVQSIE